MPAISVNLIVRDCPEALEKCLISVYETLYVDGDETVVVDTGSSPENLAKIRQVVEDFHGARVVEFSDACEDMRPLAEKWIPDWAHLCETKTMKSFAAARQRALEESRNPVVFWIDSDDVLTDPSHGGLRDTVDRFMDPEKPQVASIFLDYNYDHAPDGQCITVLRRERFVFRDSFHWLGRCHEVCIPKPGTPSLPNGYFESLTARVVHQKPSSGGEPARRSDVRNYLIQRRELEEHGDAVDKRTLFYLANAARGLQQWHESIALYKKFAPLSGSADDRWASWYSVGNIYLTPEVARPLDAEDAFLEAIKVAPFDPRGYFGVARAYASLERWQESLFWYKVGCELPEPQGLHSWDPTQVYYHPHLLASRAQYELKNYEKALEHAQIAAAWRQRSLGRTLPEDDVALGMVRETQNALAGGEIARGVAALTRNIENPGVPNALRLGRAICDELRAIPGDLEDHGIARTEPPDPRAPAPSVAIWTGATGEKWGPRSGLTGIGGSEKMVLLMARELQRRGANVSVYANMSHQDRGVDPETGVLWRHWAEFDEKRPRKVLVVWRAVEAVTRLQCPAKKRVLWLHDVQSPDRYTEDVRAVVDLVQFQSNFHASPFAPDDPLREKFWIARNALEGVHPAAARLDFSAKDPKLVAYLSSPDRGLLTAAKIVKRAQEIDPEIRFVCCYGIAPWVRRWHAKQPHGHNPDLGRDVSCDVYERALHRALDACGAVVLGRVGWAKVYETLQRAGAWLYPTAFSEISCMAGFEAAAHGCVPVATTFGALQETLGKIGAPWFDRYLLPPKKDDDEWIATCARRLTEAVQVPADAASRVAMARAAQKAFDPGVLAEEWIDKLGLR